MKIKNRRERLKRRRQAYDDLMKKVPPSEARRYAGYRRPGSLKK